MEKEVVETTLGPVPVWWRGRDGDPLVVVIRGAFAGPNDLEWLDFPDFQLAFVHLPGFHTPRFQSPSIAGFAQAFTETFAKREYIAVGVSTGALVAMSLPAKSVVAIEPFLTTAALWPLYELFAKHARSERPGDWSPAAGEWADAVFGQPPDFRDYRSVLARLRAPARVVVGDVPLLPIRRLTAMPSLCSDSDREAFRAHPLVHMTEAVGGHALPNVAIETALRSVLMELSAPE
jgi:hypothetical protein